MNNSTSSFDETEVVNPGLSEGLGFVSGLDPNLDHTGLPPLTNTHRLRGMPPLMRGNPMFADRLGLNAPMTVESLMHLMMQRDDETRRLAEEERRLRDEDNRRREEDSRRQTELMLSLVSQLAQVSAASRNTTQTTDSYQIMPDLANTIANFSGEDDSNRATAWINSIESMAKLHRWPEPFMLESARTHLVGAAEHWFARCSSDLTTWAEFRRKFTSTFLRTSGLPQRWKRLQSRVQFKGENSHVYFHEKARYCQDLDLTFLDAKQQLLAGLWSRQACAHLMGQTHNDFDDLLSDLRDFETMELERVEIVRKRSEHQERNSETAHRARLPAAPTASKNQPPVTETRSNPTSGTPRTGKPPPRAQPSYRSDSGETMCFNCSKYGHLARECPEPPRVRFCMKCRTEGHTQRHCPKFTGPPQAQQQAPRTQNLIEDHEETAPLKYLKTVKVNNFLELVGLIDCGSSCCTIQESAAIQSGLPILPSSLELFAFGDTTNAAVKPKGMINANLEIDGVIGGQVPLLIVPDNAQSTSLLIGRTYTDLPHVAYLKLKNRLIIGDKDEEPFCNIQLPPVKQAMKIMLADKSTLFKHSVNFVRVVTSGSTESTVLPVTNNTSKDVILAQGHCLTRLDSIREMPQIKTNETTTIEATDLNVDEKIRKEDIDVLHTLITEYRDCFALSLAELGCTNLMEMEIKEIEGSKPVTCKPYRTTAQEREEIGRIVSEWKQHGIVTETHSPYASPVLLVGKKTGEKRLVIDYRRLNAQTVKEHYPLPNIDDQLEQLAGAKLFTILDLAHGYLQVPLSADAKAKTAFVTPDTTGQFERLIFGLANGPSVFSRLMNRVLGSLRYNVAMCYLDDILIVAKEWPEMICKLRQVFEVLREAHLTLKLSKCEFGKRSIEFLGFNIAEGTIYPGARKMKTIGEYPRPTSVFDIRRYLGLTSYFRRFIQSYASRAEPLSNLTKKDVKFRWTENQEWAFRDLQRALVSAPCLQLYNPKARTEVHTDASAVGLAGMLLQEGDDNQLHLVYCVSKKTTNAEKNYHSSKLELMAIVWSLDRLRQFILGIPITIVTDCQALVYLNTKKTLNPQVARWANLIEEYDITEIKHRPGVKMTHVDALSRAPTELQSDTMEELIVNRLDVLQTLSLEDQMLMIQHSDPALQELVEILRKDDNDRTKEEKRQTQNYDLSKGRLFRVITKANKSKRLYVIPKPMRKSILVKFHDLMGHFSVDRVVASISERYWFANMRRYARQHIHMCMECLLYKKKGGKTAGLLHPIPPGNRPFAVIHIDHLGPFIKSSSGNQELLVLTDNLTKFVKLYASKDTSTKNVLKCMEDFSVEKGLPDKIISDRGTCFTSEKFEAYCQSNGIHHTLNSPRHPHGNGQVERVNRTLIPLISMAIKDPDHRDWDKHLREIARDANNAVNKTTGKSPFQLLHGYIPRFYDGQLRALTAVDEEEWVDPSILQSTARETIIKKQVSMKKKYDQRHCKGLTYDVGEIVFMSKAPTHTGQPTKTQPKYRGPLVVSKVLPGDTYRVSQLEEDMPGRFYSSTAHTSQLKGWKCASEDEDDDDIDSTNEPIYEEATPTDNNNKSDAPAVLCEPEIPTEIPRTGRIRKKPARLQDYV